MPLWIWERSQWPRFDWDAKALQTGLRDAYRAQGKLLGLIHVNDRGESILTQIDILVANAITTFQIEGERLDASSVRSSLARRLGLARAGLTDAQSDGVANMLIDATRNHEEPLSEIRLHQWHNDIFPYPGPPGVNIGCWRGDETMRVISGVVGREKVHFEAPPRRSLEKRMQRFIDWFNQSENDGGTDGLIRAGLAHLWFVTLHPYDDGNGRIARAVTDLALAQAEDRSIRLYAMSAAIVERRRAYYAILEKTQKGGLNITPWLQWFLATLTRAMEQAVDKTKAVLQKTRFWRKHAQTTLNQRQRKTLNRLLDAGPGGFEGGLNARKYKSMNRVSKATATRDLTDMLDKGCLAKRPGGGRSVSYDIAWP